MARHHAVMDLALTEVAEGRIKRLIVEMPPRHGKLLADSTPVLTPTGWTDHGSLVRGSRVVGIDGLPIRVVRVSQPGVADHLVRFSNGEAIKAHSLHEWTVFHARRESWLTLETWHVGELARQGELLFLPSTEGTRKPLVRVVSVEPCDPEPGKCVMVDSRDGLYLVGNASIPTHNSELCSRYFPAWVMMRRPTNVIVTGATADLANDFSQKARELCLEHGLELFNVMIAGGRKRLSDWALTNGSRVRVAGVGGNIMGRGADLFIIDDYFKNVDEALSQLKRRKLLEWYLSTAQTRLSPNGAVVVIATRWHPEDLIGQLLQMEQQGGDKWTRIRFEAIAEENDPLGRQPGEALWPEVWPADRLDATRTTYQLGGYPWMWDSLYQQRPPAILDAIWEPELFQGDDLWFTDWPDPKDVQFRVAALDPSLGESESADYSAIVYAAVTNDGFVYIDADIARRDPFRITEDAIQVCRMFGPNAFAVESNQFQRFLADYFAKAAQEQGLLLPLVKVNNSKSKTGRINAGLSSFLRRRQLRFRRRSPGVSLLLKQLRHFPAYDHDDGPDALEMAIRIAQMINSGRLPK